ncbi:MAG: NifU family protein [Bacteroidales bacterium]|nr:NifU family protein [Bacteroidales bacterium]MCF8344919.1 NifU family protein [Bacteroidales bacterium]MCF8349714.1 NifU family protein [Bacteroidales bacterium]MCF8376685.1 NifU family protein [Bacteroidales bacterium]MCF8401768.1 NifU family protein [Bacteroidales bacterium]
MTEKKELTDKVKNVIEQIRPYLQQDGGDINFVEITEDNVVNVELTGACGSCPYSTMTLKSGVETAVKKAIPEIKSVEAINLG